MTIRYYLYIAFCLVAFAACQQPAATPAAEAATTKSNIVFIRVDSLTKKYTALADKTKSLEKKFSEMDAAQNERVAALQRDVQSFQRRANSGTMAPKQIGVEQERLAGREQALLQQAEQMRQELQIEQLNLMGEYEENLTTVLEAIQEEFGYDYILNYGASTGVLMAKDAHDITAEVAKRINLIPMDGKSDKNTEADASDEAAPAAGE